MAQISSMRWGHWEPIVLTNWHTKIQIEFTDFMMKGFLLCHLGTLWGLKPDLSSSFMLLKITRSIFALLLLPTFPSNRRYICGDRLWPRRLILFFFTLPSANLMTGESTFFIQLGYSCKSLAFLLKTGKYYIIITLSSSFIKESKLAIVPVCQRFLWETMTLVLCSGMH